MPNQHAADKEVIGFYIPRTLAQRVRKAAASRGITITAFVEESLHHATRHTELTPEDYHIIAQATQRALDGKGAKRTRTKTQDRGSQGKTSRQSSN